MSNSANIPALGNKIVVDIPALNALLRQMIQAELSNVTDLPTRAKQLVEGASGWEVQQFNGSGWATLENWNVNAQKVGGFSASQSATKNTIAVRDANGKLAGDITGNAATATKAAALSAANPVNMGGTGATTAEGARENLGIKDLLEVVNSRVDAANGDIDGLEAGLATTNSNISALGKELDALSASVASAQTSQAAKDSAQDTAIAGVEASVAALDGNVVHKTGDEDIEGRKVFTEAPWIKNNKLSIPEWTNETINKYLYCVDKNEDPISAIQFRQAEDVNAIRFLMREPKDNMSTFSSSTLFWVGVEADGTKVVAGVTPAEGDNSTKLATTAWVRGKGVLIESWHEGTEWYRKYSDGWIEQGGVAGGSNMYTQVTLHQPMKDANYMIFGMTNDPNGNGAFSSVAIIKESNSYVRTTGFKTTQAYSSQGKVGKFNWLVMGMGA